MKFVDTYEEKDHQDPERDIPNTRLMHLSNGRTFKMERKDPYGFVSVLWDKGPVPQELSGLYTDFELAQRALTIYINNNIHGSVSDTPVETAPPLAYKQRYRDPKTGENLKLA